MATLDHTATDPERFFPSTALRSAARRAMIPLALAGAAVTVAILAGGPLELLADALARALDADPRWIAFAAVAELLSFAGYIALFWFVGRDASPRLDLRAGADITLAGAAATRLLPTGGAGGAALTLWAIARTGLGAERGGRVLLSFLALLYGVFLFGIAAAGAAVALGAGHAIAGGVAALLATTAILVGLVLGTRSVSAPEDAGRVRRGAALLSGGIRDALGLLGRGDPRLLGAPAWWAFDAAVLWAAFHALGEPPALGVLAFAYFVGQVGNTIPLPGAVSGGMVGVLLAFGVAPDLALTSVLAYRAVAIWLPAPLGLAALATLRARVARWTEEDARAALATPAAAPAAAPAPVRRPAAPVFAPAAGFAFAAALAPAPGRAAPAFVPPPRFPPGGAWPFAMTGADAAGAAREHCTA